VAKSVACYRLHETVREFARLMLRAAGEEEAVERRCVDYFVARSQRASVGARYRLLEWLDWAELAIDNVRASLRRCVTEADVARGLVLASALGWYWITRATTEGVRWLDELFAAGDGVPAVHAWAYFMRGFLAVLKGDPATAMRSLERAVSGARESGQLLALAHSLAMASVAEVMAGHRESASRLLGEAQAVAEPLDDVSATVAVLQTRAIHAFLAGDLDAVEAACTVGERLSREAGDLYSLEHMLFNLGGARLMAGDTRAARPLLEEALHIAHQIDDRIVQSYALATLGCLAAAVGEARLAARLMGAAEDVRLGAGATMNPITAAGLERARAAAAGALGAARYDAEFAGGKRASGEVVKELARAQAAPEGRAATAPPGAGEGPLGKREGEVAQLIADGLSNKEIGARLFISDRTVESHVRNILNKLGLNSRVQIASWLSSLDAAQ
jgi:ATP/maltotriose-dependent transcriptional regulator MalT